MSREHRGTKRSMKVIPKRRTSRCKEPGLGHSCTNWGRERSHKCNGWIRIIAAADANVVSYFGWLAKWQTI